MSIKHDIKPERLDRFVSSPLGNKIEFPNGDKMTVVKDGSNGCKLKKIEIK